MKKYYLAHNFLTRKLRRKWELKIEAKYNIILDNPFYDNPHRAMEMHILDGYKDGSTEQNAYLSNRDENSIVNDDLEKIRKSDGIIALANDVRVGTLMEIFYASHVLRLPVYVLTRKYYNHPWIKKFATKRFRNMKELEEFIAEKFGVKK
jgi:nucleoside 2-deoxyribosyltransferase